MVDIKSMSQILKKIRQEESDEEGIETEYVEIKEKAQIKLLKRYQEGKTLGAQTLDTANTALIAPENKTDQKDCEEGKKPSNKNKQLTAQDYGIKAQGNIVKVQGKGVKIERKDVKVQEVNKASQKEAPSQNASNWKFLTDDREKIKPKFISKQAEKAERKEKPLHAQTQKINYVLKDDVSKTGQKKTVQSKVGEDVYEQSSQIENYIYIGNRSVQEYLQKVQQMIQKYDYIALKAVGYHVAKAFLVSERAARSIALYRISIPGTVMEAGTQRRATVLIELSVKKDELLTNHVGYEDLKTKKAKKKEYKAKQISDERDYR